MKESRQIPKTTALVHAFCKPVFEFHISRQVREYYQLDESLFAQTGNVILINFFMVRLLAAKMNKQRDLATYPEKTIKAGQLNGMGLIDEILHYIVGLYKEENNRSLFGEFDTYLQKKIGANKLNATLQKFIDFFPPLAVYKNKVSPKEYLTKSSGGVSNREIALEELMIFYLANANPAFENFRELFDDTALSKETEYKKITALLFDFFKDRPLFGPDNQTLIDMLRTPAVKYPHSIESQLDFIREHWGTMLSKFIARLFGSLDLLKEENKAIFGGPGPSMVPDFRKLISEEEFERFSTDLHWMPNVVMIAKSTYVWMDQLSKKYQRHIHKLDHIPDEELALLSQRGFNALWLIGIWERSAASQKIKQMCGNPEAVSSAYSLYDYVIATDLGGDAAFENLGNRASRYGIRLASDMVPNHTGIFSKWVTEHPDWFVQAEHPVFPAYSFNGPNLSDDDRMGIYIEDGYWNRSDAAVLFKRVDFSSGETRFIYHGNDGTSMPWNDTAQLNFLLAEVREAVIQTILHVARKFSIIRLDAAMTLAKRHFQRLWFPQPGSGGDIPSRGEFALTMEEFNHLFPEEFWRQVVDRVAVEVPDTLLLAEAFWMMEGYFVRTLGMHRVYNSAFMNMLKNEENQKYRQAIKSVMDFNPEIMKRYVNFMNNPDEETALAQFGKDDKYFGVCIVMVTLPGLPMFGHGQVEGFSEKYGMEYRRAYWDEQEDIHLIHRHEREIFPLLKKRYLFSEVQNFILYDLHDPNGSVNEDVYIYTNRAGNERALVIYNNRYQQSTGWIRHSSASARKTGNSFAYYNLREGLSLDDDHTMYTIFRDQVSGLEYIRNNRDLDRAGLFVTLDGFKYHVFLDFRQVKDNQYRHYEQLANYLEGRGVPNIDEALKETFLMPIHAPFRELLAEQFVKSLIPPKTGPVKPPKPQIDLEFSTKLKDLLNNIRSYTGSKGSHTELISDLKQKYTRLHLIAGLQKIAVKDRRNYLNKMITFLKQIDVPVISFYMWLITHQLGKIEDENNVAMVSYAWLDEFLLTKIILQHLASLGFETNAAARQLLLIECLILHPNWFSKARKNLGAALDALLQTPEIQKYLQFNRYQGNLFFNLESLQELLGAFMCIAAIESPQKISPKSEKFKEMLTSDFKIIVKVLELADKAGYRVEQVLKLTATSKVKKAGI